MHIRNFVLAAAIAVATVSTPALAAGKHNRAGFEAYGQVPAATESLSADREKALRDCNAATGSMREYTWGVAIAQAYRSCMTEHGQPE